MKSCQLNYSIHKTKYTNQHYLHAIFHSAELQSVSADFLF